MAKNEQSYAWGYEDGKLSARLTRPFHNAWKRNQEGDFIHHDPAYLEGYVKGWEEVKGVKP